MTFDVSEILRKIGLSDKEIALYLASLQLKTPQPVTLLAKKSRMNRTTAYDVLNDLFEKGFFSRFTQHHVQHYLALPPDDLIDLLEMRDDSLHRQIREMRLSIPHFKNFMNHQDLPRPEVRYFFGEEGMRILLKSAFHSHGSSYIPLHIWLDYFSVHHIGALFSYHLKKTFLQNRGHHFIFPEAPNVRAYLSGFLKDFSKQVCFLPSGYFSIQSGIFVTDTSLQIIYPFADHPFGFVLENKEIAEFQRSLFHLLWARTKSDNSSE